MKYERDWAHRIYGDVSIGPVGTASAKRTAECGLYSCRIKQNIVPHLGAA